MMSRKGLRLPLILIVPVFAALVFARQVYLQHANGLSLWRGGGMGMFAGIGSPSHRFLKIYLTEGDLPPEPVTRLTRGQNVHYLRAVAEPTQANLAALGRAVADTSWLRRDTDISRRMDSTGKILGPMERQYKVLVADGPRAAGEDEAVPVSVRIEYWENAYDPATGRLSASLVKSLTYRP